MNKSMHITNITYNEYDDSAIYYITYPGVIPKMYGIKTNGTIYSLVKHREKEMTIEYDKNLYSRISLLSNTNSKIKRRKYLVSRLVLWEFVSRPEDYLELEGNHADGDHFNNYYKNLEWTTTKENATHKKILGLAASSERHGWNKHKEIVVYDVIEMIKQDFSAPYIASVILKKYPSLYSSKTKKDYDRLRGLVSKIKCGYSWDSLYKNKSSTTIESIPYEKHVGKEAIRVGYNLTKVDIRNGRLD